MKTVQVTVSGGVVKHAAVPEGVTVIVHDYDVEDIESDLLQQDRGGVGWSISCNVGCLGCVKTLMLLPVGPTGQLYVSPGQRPG